VLTAELLDLIHARSSWLSTSECTFSPLRNPDATDLVGFTTLGRHAVPQGKRHRRISILGRY